MARPNISTNAVKSLLEKSVGWSTVERLVNESNYSVVTIRHTLAVLELKGEIEVNKAQRPYAYRIKQQPIEGE